MNVSDYRYDMWREVTILSKDLSAGRLTTEDQLIKIRRKNELITQLLQKQPITYEVMLDQAKSYWKASQTEENPLKQAAYLMQCFEYCASAGIKPLDFMQTAEYLC